MTTYQWESGVLPAVTGTVTTDAATGIPTTPSMQVSGSATASYVLFEVATSKTVSIRFYFRTPSAWASSSCNIMGLRPDNSGIVAQVTIAGTGAPGQLRLGKTGGVTVASSPSGTLAVSTDYRIELQYNGNTTEATISVFPLQSDTALWTSTVTDATFNLDAIRADFGRINNSPTLPSDVWYDSILIDNASTALLGRVTGDDLVVDPEDPEDPEEPEEPAEYPFIWESTTHELPTPEGSGVVEVEHDPADYISVTQEAGLTAFFQYNLPVDSSSVTARAYFRQTAHASASWSIITARVNFAGVQATLTLSGSGQPGQARLTTGSTTIIQSASNTLALNRWYRGELMVNPTTVMARAAVFGVGSSTPIWDSGWQTHSAFDVAPTMIQYGRTTSTPTAPQFMMKFIHVKGTATDWVGTATTREVSLRLWDGTNIRDASLVGVWDGTTVRDARIL